MIRLKPSHAFRLTALAVAVAAVTAPIAWSGSRAPVVDRTAAQSRMSAAQDEGHDRFIVTYRDNARAARTSLESRYAGKAGNLGLGIQGLRTLATGADVIRTDRKLDLAESKQLMAELMKDPNIFAVEADVRMKPLFTPNDPLYAQQWHYKAGAGGANLEPAWDITRGAGIVVGVIDTGIVPHSEFAGQLVPGYDFIGDLDTAVDGDGRDADPNDPGDWHDGECNIFGIAEDSSWHGTHVAGTISALTDNGVGGAGVAPGAKILPIRALGKCGGFLSDIVDGITWGSGGTVAGVPANANPAEVLNLSLGGGGACSVAFQNAIDAAVARGTTVVVAAGNSGGDAASQQPASCNNVVAVSAVGPTGALASYSSFGPVVDVAAPGGSGAAPASDNVLSTLNLGLTTQGAEGYGWYAGTSMASPHVAGIVALMQSASSTPKTPAQVKKILENTAYANGGFPGGCSYDKPCGTGIVDATAAVRVANGTDPLPSDPPPPPPPPPATELFNGVTVSNLSVGANGELKYQLVVPNGASNLLFAMYGGTGDADVYVRYGAPPTNSAFDCRPFSFGNNENCFFPAPRAGVWYVTIKGFSAAAGISLYPSFVDANYPYKQAATVEQLTNHRTRVALTWQHGKKQVDIYRNGLIYNSRRNTYTFTDTFRIVGSGTMTYKICNQGTSECSDEVSVNYSSKK
ncbi:S8 family peptidase [Lysobacter brunescens]|uniref:S8 family peptidase n=1 Tax=Lysobacter brunescens TaxID=262323 RepID=A0ABW2YEZ2_9GAMM